MTIDPIERLPPEMSKLTTGVLRRLRAQLPGAVEFVYDKKNSLVIGFGPDERPSNAMTCADPPLDPRARRRVIIRQVRKS